MYNLIITFTILQIVNVIASTIRSLVTIKGGKWSASIASALYFAYYTIVVIYTVADFPLWQKCAITFGTNLIGVFIVKIFEEKMRKDKLWLVKCTLPKANAENFKTLLTATDIPFTYYDINKYMVFDCFCEKQKDTALVTELCKKNHGKMFASENKLY